MPEVTLTLTAAKVITAEQINKAFGKLKVEIVSATAIGTDGRKWTVVFPTPEAAGTAKAKADYDLTINNGRVGYLFRWCSRWLRVGNELSIRRHNWISACTLRDYEPTHYN